MRTSAELAFNVLVRFEDGLWVAHCLELDIVATGGSPDEAINDIKDLILAQVSCAMSNRNMDYLYHPAPQQVWDEYRRARALKEFRSADITPSPEESFFQTIFTNAFAGSACHA